MRRRRARASPRASGSFSTHTTGICSSWSRTSTRVPILPRPSSTTCPDRRRGGRRRAVAVRKAPRASNAAATRTGSRSRPTKPERICRTWRCGGSSTAGSLIAKMSRRVMYAACRGCSPVVCQEAAAMAATAATMPTSDQRSCREKSEPNGSAAGPRRGAACAAPVWVTASRATMPRPVAAVTSRSSGSSCGPWSPLSSDPSLPAGSLVVAESKANVHRPGSAVCPRCGGVRSTARSSRPSACTILLVPATAVAARAGAAVSASDSTVVEESSSRRSMPGSATIAAWSRSSSRCWPSLRL